jgi:zinc transporter ZupT
VLHPPGDFATLIRAGYSTRQAVETQFLTAIAAFLGTLIAIFTVHYSKANSVNSNHGERLVWITSGGFIYLAAVTILPEVLTDEPPFKGNTGTSMWALVYFRTTQALAFLTGIGFLYAVALLEDHDHTHHHHDHSHHAGIRTPEL